MDVSMDDRLLQNILLIRSIRKLTPKQRDKIYKPFRKKTKRLLLDILKREEYDGPR
jgi:hypothetical protein